MTLGIFLALGDSFEDMEKSGQATRFKKIYLNYFSKNFEKVYVFSYANEKPKNLPKNVEVVANSFKLHRFLYGLLLPFLNLNKITECDVIRAYHLSGTYPALISKLIFHKPFIFNYAFDYVNFAKIEKKILQMYLFQFLEPLAIFMSSKIFVASKSLTKKVKPRSKIKYLPNGVDVNLFKPTRINRMDKSIILSVGRLQSQKNFKNLVKATKGLNCNLVIVGNGGQKKELERLAKSLKVNLKIIDKIENTKLPHVYNQSTIFVLPSLVEGHPKALLEAMACAKPCIGANVEGIKEIIVNHQTGTLCKTNALSLRKAISSLISNPRLMKKLGQKAREHVEKNYNLKNLLAEEIRAIKSINIR